MGRNGFLSAFLTSPEELPSPILFGACPAFSSPPLQTPGCKPCSPTSNTASQHLPQVPHLLPPPPPPTRTSACSAWQRRTSTRACQTRGRRRSSFRPSSPWPRQEVLMQTCSPRWSIEVRLQANCRPFFVFSVLSIHSSFYSVRQKACSKCDIYTFQLIYEF